MPTKTKGFLFFFSFRDALPDFIPILNHISLIGRKNHLKNDWGKLYSGQLYNLKHEKLDTALYQVQSLIAKYLVIASEGNQQIAGTMRKFVGELEHLFDNAVRIEYEYYIKKEQAKQEQLALRQQMREEAEERKRLEEQKKQIAFEESKYQAEIAKVKELLSLEAEDSPKRADIMAKLEELNTQLGQVEEKKEEISKLQNGKAGNVYIISNLGSFGDHVFKIGMTRRLDPQERVDELGSASVPFKFDVHSFIFSEDAVGLENELYSRLHAERPKPRSYIDLV